MQDNTWQQNATRFLLESPPDSPRTAAAQADTQYYSHAAGPPSEPALLNFHAAGTHSPSPLGFHPIATPDILHSIPEGDPGAGSGYPPMWPGAMHTEQPGVPVSDHVLAQGLPVGTLDDPFERPSYDGVSAIAQALGNSSLRNRSSPDGSLTPDAAAMAEAAAAAAAAAVAQAPPPPVPYTRVHTAPRQASADLDAIAPPVRMYSAPRHAIPGYMGAPEDGYLAPASATAASALQLSQFQKRQRSAKSQLTFEAYENQYGPSAK